MATPNSNFAFKCPPTLPLDVLFEIFKAYIQDYHHTRPFSLMRRPKEVPWFLGHICRQWRMAAIITPQLWKRLPPLKLTTQRDAHDKHMAMFEELLKRSSSHPIRVQFEFACEQGDADLEVGVFTPLLATSRRWEEVTVRCPFARTVASLFDGIEGRIPHVRRVELLLLDDEKLKENRSGEKAPEKLVDIFCKTPMLSELFLQISPSSFPTLPVPWEQLTKLQWDDGEGIYDVLKYAKNLDTLMTVECESMSLNNPPNLRHSKLRRFHIRVKENRVFSELLCRLELPALEALVITQDPDWPYLYWDLPYILPPLFVRSQCDLKHLVLDAGELEDSDLLDILEVTPNLESLEVSAGSADFDEILSWLVFEETKETLLPYLHTLTLVFPLEINARQVAMIRRIVASRNQVIVEGENLPGLLFSPLHNVCVRVKPAYLRFQVCLDLNGENVDTTFPVHFFVEPRFEHLVSMKRRDLDQAVVALDEHQIAEVFRFLHTYRHSGEDNYSSIRKTCQSLVTEDFINSLEWMMAGNKDIVYIHSEHELRSSANRWDIALGMYDGGPELLKGYRDSEIFAEPRKWWNSGTSYTRR